MPRRRRHRYFQKYLLTARKCFKQQNFCEGKMGRSKKFGGSVAAANFAPGEVAERSIAAVLKTVEGHTSGGSNPSLSAGINRLR